MAITMTSIRLDTQLAWCLVPQVRVPLLDANLGKERSAGRVARVSRLSRPG